MYKGLSRELSSATVSLLLVLVCRVVFLLMYIIPDVVQWMFPRTADGMFLFIYSTHFGWCLTVLVGILGSG